MNPSEYAYYITQDLPNEIAFLSLFAIGQSFVWENNYSDAIITFDKALESLPIENSITEWLPFFYELRGFTYLRDGKLEKAIANLNNAIQLDPENALAYYLRGRAYLDCIMIM